VHSDGGYACDFSLVRKTAFFSNELFPSEPDLLLSVLTDDAGKLNDGFIPDRRALATLVRFKAKPPLVCRIRARGDYAGEAWTNIAVLAGAWIFIVFLCASIVNQFFTLSAISSEIQRQRNRLEGDFAAVSAKFVGTFDSLANRICWYRFVFIVIAIVGLVGAVFATFAYRSFDGGESRWLYLVIGSLAVKGRVT
jgi:hypothetical protein